MFHSPLICGATSLLTSKIISEHPTRHFPLSLAKQKFTVALMDLDSQGSLTLFCGLNPPEPEQTLAAVLRDDFDGNWPLTPCWPEHTKNVVICQGEMILTQTADELVLHKRGAYLLTDALTDYPLGKDRRVRLLS